jgi:prolipoprotein diacylglyceryltransferase
VAAQGLPADLHSTDEGVFTQRSLLPVSICNLNDCTGVPIVTFAKYRVTYGIIRIVIETSKSHDIPHCQEFLRQFQLSSVIDLLLMDPLVHWSVFVVLTLQCTSRTDQRLRQAPEDLS